MKSVIMAFIVAAASFAILAAKSNGAVFHVTTSAELQTALDTARTNGEDDTIELLATSYTTLGSSFSYGTASNDNHAVTLSGGWNTQFTAQIDDPYETQLDGGGLNPVLQIDSNAPGVNITFIIENLTIQNGYARSADYSGAGILTFTGQAGSGSINLTIQNCIFQNNNAPNNKSGGAIYSTGSIEVYDTKFLSNSAYNGGAIVLAYDIDESQSASPVIENCDFEDNSNYGNQGSTIWTNCAPRISGCTFKGRSNGGSSGNGSCIWGNNGSHLNIVNSVFSDITIKYWGPAIQVWYSDLDVTNCLFANNLAGYSGDGYGAIAILSSADSINITNCTFVGNTDSSSYSGAINNRGAILNLNNCIFWENDGVTGVYNESGTTTMRYCLYENGTMGYGVTDGGGNISDDPGFIGDGIYHLGHWSPCIDAGNNNLVPADSQDLDNDGNTAEPTPLDLKDQPRFYDDPCTDDTGLGTAPIVDIGAFEFEPAMFGTVNGKNVKLTLTDCDGNNVTFSLTGGGYGQIDETDCSFSEIVLHETTEKSQFTISTKGKNETSVGDIIVNGPLKSISAKTTNVSGWIEIDGSLASLTLNDADCYHKQLRIGSSLTNPNASVTMSFDRIYGLQISSDIPVKSLSATDWTGSDTDFSAPWVGSITVKGDKKRNIAGNVNAYIYLTGSGAPKNLSLKTAKIAGQITGGFVISAGNCGTIQAAASTASTAIHVNDGNLASLKITGNTNAGINAVLSGEIICNSAKSISTTDIDDSVLNFHRAADPAGKKLALGTLTAKGLISNSRIISSGNIGTVTAGKMVNTSCFAGVADACLVDVNAADSVYDLPPVLGDTFNQTATIKSIAIKGIKGEDPNFFINSNIAAVNISSAYVAYPEYNNAGVPFGISMWNNPTKTFTIKDADGTHSWKGIDIGEAIDWLTAMGYNMEIRRD